MDWIGSPHLSHMSKEVESYPLEKAMEKGFLNDLRIFRMKNHKFFVSILMDSLNSFVQHIKQGFQDYFEFIKGDTEDEAEVEKHRRYWTKNITL